jgi:hypothetical protein
MTKNRWTSSPDYYTPTNITHKRDALFAGIASSDECHGGVEVREHMHYNGSGPRAFGGAERWPVVTADVSLPAGRLDLRKKLAEELRAHIDAFLTKHGLDGDP